VVARGYTTAALVAKEMGTDLTAPQLDQCADMIAAAESVVDLETGRTWLTASSSATELHTVLGPAVYLENRPVVSITSAQMRPMSVGAAQRTLTAGTDYELIDPTNGVLLLAGYAYPRDVVINTEYTSHQGFILTVVYTHAMVLDPAIQKITSELVAYWMQRRTTIDTSDIKSFEAPDLLSITYRDNAGSSRDVPPDITRRLQAYSKVILA
jgi:hypothetical protein